QPFGGVIGGGAGGDTGTPVATGGGTSGTSFGGSMTTSGGAEAPANFGLPIGIAAASPFVALLGKILKKKSDD
ncbi:MAG TPA: RNA polymerase subunit sigma-24, partial [Anaerolineae bacterium]|nr:RNA polymerase subunit sigma-24 [Anaerolineae bacterium]